MKKYLALLLIAIMAVSVLSAAGVVTTQKAAAAPLQSSIAVVNYKPGATYRYAPWQFNQNFAGFYASSEGTIAHFETTGGGTAYSSIRTTQTQAGVSYATVGMWWQLRLPKGATWNTVENMPCTVTVTVLYVIQANGNQGTYAQAVWGVNNGNETYSIVYGNNLHVKTATTTFHTTVGGVFSDGPYGGAYAEADTWQHPAGAGHASAVIVCSSIVLAFPQAP